MFHKNPITRFLYSFGYDGIEDINNFWLINKKEVIRHYKLNSNDSDFDYNFQDFEHKIKWASIWGIFMRFEISNYLSLTNDTIANFSKIKVRYDGKFTSISDFNNSLTKSEMSHQGTDLRGASLTRLKVSNIKIEGVNFDFCSIINCTFENVTFENCSFYRTDLSRSKFIDSIFSKSCVFQKVKFEGALIRSEFMCELPQSIISEMKCVFLTNKSIKYHLKYPTFTIIQSPSFVKMSNCELVRIQFRKQSRFQLK